MNTPSRDACEVCDFIGPEMPGLPADIRAMHRAGADLGLALATALHLPRLAGWLARRLTLIP